MRWWFLFPLALVAAGAATSPEFNSAQTKLRRIAGGLPTGSSVRFTVREINAYASGRAEKSEGAVSNTRLVLGNNQATGYAQVDFVRLLRVAGIQPNETLAKLFAGEHPVSFVMRVQSSRGNCRVDVDRVEIDGIPIEGAVLDFLVQHFLRPWVPDAKIGEPFELGHGIERVEVASAGVRVVVGN